VQTITKEIDISDVTKLIADGQDLSIEVASESAEKAVLSGRQVDLDAINVKNENSELSFSEIKSENSLCLECNHHPVKLIISDDKLTEIRAENGAVINIGKGLQNISVLTADNNSNINLQDAIISGLTVASNSRSTIDIYGTVSDTTLITNDGDINLDNLNGNTAKVDLSGNNSRINLSGKIDNLFVINKSSGGENILNCIDLQNKITTIDATGKIVVVTGETDQIKLNQSANVNLFYTGNSKIIGGLDGSRFLNYQNVSRTEFLRSENEIESEDNSENNRLFIRTNGNYFILNRGKLLESDFEDLFEIFQSTVY